MKRANKDITEVPESDGDISEVPESNVSDTEDVPGSPCLRKVKEQHWDITKPRSRILVVHLPFQYPASAHPQDPGN